VLRGDEVSYVEKVADFMAHDPNSVEAVGGGSIGINNKWVFSTYIPLKSPDWAVVVEIPLWQAYWPVMLNILFSSIGALLVIILAGAAGGYAAGFLTAPIFALTQIATRIAQGELTLEAQVIGPTEVNRLAQAFNSMTRQLRELIGNLENQARHLEVKERKYRTLFEDSKDAIFITDLTGRLLEMNPAGLAILGYTQTEITQLQIEDMYVHPTDFDRISLELAQKQAIKDFELVLKNKAGIEIDCLITATLRQDDDGQLVGFQGMARDITAQKQAQQQRLQLSTIQRELAIASEIQQSLLPPPKPVWPDLDVACYSLPTYDVGGDLYAYHHFSDRADDPTSLFPHAYAIGVGDVTGKGIPAALLMAVSQATFQALVSQNLPPKEFMADFDVALMRYIRKRQNCAFVYAEFNKFDALTLVTLINAGCPAPIIKRRDGSVEMVDIGGMPLGVGLGSQMGYQSVTYTLNAGDIIILASDGLVEATNSAGEMFGFDYLEEVIQAAPTDSAEAMLAYLKQTLMTFVGGAEQHDDITIVVARV
jgi:sigma-B regulation protein RsbU (phosphoserine phosphatase)